MAPGPSRRRAGDYHLGRGPLRARQHRFLGIGARGRAIVVQSVQPWEEITTEAALADLLARGGVEHPAVRAVPGRHQLDHPDRFWDIVLGTGYRATIDALSQEQRDIVREHLLGRLRSEGITSVRTDVIFSTAQRPH